MLRRSRSVGDMSTQGAAIGNNNNNNVADRENRGANETPRNVMEIGQGSPFHHQLNKVICSVVRWFYVNSKNVEVPFNDNDSLTLEIMYRLLKGEELDSEAQQIYDKHLEPYYSFVTVTSTSTESTKPPLFLNHLYKVSNSGMKSIEPVYWRGNAIPIKRGAYLSLSGVLEHPLVVQLQRQQDEARVSKYPHWEYFDVKYESGTKTKVAACWYTSTMLVIQKDQQKTRTLLWHYPSPACWDVNLSKVDNLVFAVHGIGNNNNVQGIVENAKRLNEGVNSKTRKGCGIVFLPIHWRTGLATNHKCPKIVGRKSARLQNLAEDLKMYNCKDCGDKIHKKVISEINRLYKIFKKYHPEFVGPISFFGHSLGSVIYYDIVSTKSLRRRLEFKKPVEKLFVVGSPLWYFFELRGRESMTQFRKMVNKLQIYNFHHSNDPVSGRLEAFYDKFYTLTAPIGIPVNVKRRSFRWRGAHSTIQKTVRHFHLKIRQMEMFEGVERLTFPIDYEVISDDIENYHSIYWKLDSVHTIIQLILNVHNRQQPERLSTSHSSLSSIERQNSKEN